MENPAPALLTKKWLKNYFGIRLRDERGQLRKLVFTDPILLELQLTEDEYKRIKIFDAHRSKKIKDLLNI